jgi:iron-sulfur cluster assembly protein
VRVERGAITVVVDAMSLQYLVGAEIDFEDKLDGARFVIRNPNAASTCGCGSSFSVCRRSHGHHRHPQGRLQIRKALDKRGGGVGLRLAVKTSGCSGYAYALEFADAPADDDLRFDSEGVQLLVDAGSLPMIDGTQLDWVREGLNEGFKFNNPNASATCGCGESFAV